jgi:hypothetical protein
MSRRSANRFNEREVSRAVRAVRRTGENVDRVEIDPTTGKITVILAKPCGEAAADKNEWDEAIEQSGRQGRDRNG